MASPSTPNPELGPEKPSCKKGEPCCPGKKHGGRLLLSVHNEHGHQWLTQAEEVDGSAQYELGTALLAHFFAEAVTDSRFSQFFVDYLQAHSSEFLPVQGSYTPPDRSKQSSLPCPSKVEGQVYLANQLKVTVTCVSQMKGANFVADSVRALLACEDTALAVPAKQAFNATYKAAAWFSKQVAYQGDMLPRLAKIVIPGLKQKNSKRIEDTAPEPILSAFRGRQAERAHQRRVETARRSAARCETPSGSTSAPLEKQKVCRH